MLVDQAMTTQPIAAFPTTTIRDVLGLTLDGHVRHLPLVEGNVPVGIVSLGDLRALVPRGLSDVSQPEGVQRVVRCLSTGSGLAGGAGQENHERLPHHGAGEGRVVARFCTAPPVRTAVDSLVDHKIVALPVVEVPRATNCAELWCQHHGERHERHHASGRPEHTDFPIVPNTDLE